MNSFMGSTAELAVLIKLKDEITGPLNKIDRSLSGLNTRTATVAGGMSKIGSGLALGAERLAVAGVALGGAMVAIAVSATDAAKAYQHDMELLRSQTGATQQEVDSASKAILAMAGPAATSADVLAKGLYHIESAGLRGSAALQMLQVSAAGAKTGNADLEQVTNALVGAWQSGVKGAQDMTQAMGTINAIVGAGNMRMQDLVDAMGTGILASAKTFGASMGSVGAAIATMTDEGIPAADAATRLRMTLSLLGAPTSKAAALFKGIGLSSTDLANAMRGPGGLTDAITDLHAHMVKAKMIDASGNINTAGAQFLSGAFGGGRSSSAIMTLVGNYDLLIAKQKAVTDGTTTFGDSFAATQETVAYKQAALTAGFDALRITLGEKLLPVEANVLDALTSLVSDPAVTEGISNFGDALAGMFSADNIAGAEQFVRSVVPGIKDFATGILPPLIEGLKISGQVAKGAVDMFLALPQPLQAAVIALMVGNKLTGGLVASGLGDLAKVAMGAATGSGGSGGIAGGLIGVQKVYVVNMGAGMSAAGTAAGTAAGEASGMSMTRLLMTGLTVTLAAASIYELAQEIGTFSTEVGAAKAQAASDQQAWVNTPTTAQQNTAAMQGMMDAWTSQVSNSIVGTILSDLPGTGIGDTETQGLKDAANKIANQDPSTWTQAQYDMLKKALVFSESHQQTQGASSTILSAMQKVQAALDAQKALQARAFAEAQATQRDAAAGAERASQLWLAQQQAAADQANRDAAAQLAATLQLQSALAAAGYQIPAGAGHPVQTQGDSPAPGAGWTPAGAGHPVAVQVSVSSKDVTNAANTRAGYRGGVPQ
jgi:TP901 family phage tail tape measure protein